MKAKKQRKCKNNKYFYYAIRVNSIARSNLANNCKLIYDLYGIVDKGFNLLAQ